MNLKPFKLAPVVLTFLLQACASITTGANQSVSVNTGDVQGGNMQTK